MNKTDIVQIMSKRTTKLAILSVVFAGIMAFLVPALIEEVDAIVKGKATSTAGPFSNIRWHLDHGLWTITPRVDASGNLIWETRGKGWPWPGHEDGTIWANVGGANRIVMFEFDSPPFGDNRCWATVLLGPLHSTCSIPRFGTVITATYTVTPRVQEDNGNNYCDILDKYGGEQMGAIKENLRC